jgi:hypothetical protein
MRDTFFTIDGVEDDEYPPVHPDTLKFFDRESAESWLKFCTEELKLSLPGAYVGETKISELADVK